MLTAIFGGGSAGAAELELVSAFGTPPSNTSGSRLKPAPDGWFWGTTTGGGAGDGTVYRVAPDGRWETVHRLTGRTGPAMGRDPSGGLENDGHGSLWGVTFGGGSSVSGGFAGRGTIFKIDVASRVFTTVMDFASVAGTSGTHPNRALTPDGRGFMWGSTNAGGSNFGTIFKINIQTHEFTQVIRFTGNSGAFPGEVPSCKLLRVGDTMWGTTSHGGSDGTGTLFKIDIQSGVHSVVHHFNRAASGGFSPFGELVFDPDGLIWGTTTNGGTGSSGMIYKFEIAASSLLPVVQFTGSSGAFKGANPYSGVEPDNQGVFWGSTSRGGFRNQGTLYKYDRRTGVFTTLIEFTESNGAYPDRPDTAGIVNPGDGSMWLHSSSSIHRIDAATGEYGELLRFRDGGSDDIGRMPTAGVTEGPDGIIWGTTQEGGRFGLGTVFKVDRAGKRTTIAEFTGRTGSTPGSTPAADLITDHNGFIWGSARLGGEQNLGTIFKVDPETGELETVFEHGVGMSVQEGGRGLSNAMLPGRDGMLWAALGGGLHGNGMIAKLDPETGTLEAVVHFTGNGAENKGTTPRALIQDPDGMLWGITSSGGAGGFGTLFKLDPATGLLTTLFSFTGDSGTHPGTLPIGRLFDDGEGKIWGVTWSSGSANRGTVYHVSKATGQLTRLFAFTGAAGNFPGRAPAGGFTVDPRGHLWGVTTGGGQNDVGTIYRIDPSTGQHFVEHHFGRTGLYGVFGLNPQAGTLFPHSDGNFYGTAAERGPTGAGAVFRVVMNQQVPSRITLNAPPFGALVRDGVQAAGGPLEIDLNFSPPPGLPVKVIDNRSAAFIQGEFSNLAHGQELSLEYNGQTYHFVANYFGGDGNDLVLHWKNTRLVGWGANGEGMLGRATAGQSSSGVPAPVDDSGVLAGKTIFAAAAGSNMAGAVASDGSVAAWGLSSRLGSSGPKQHGVPYLVDTSGVLAGKRVVGLTAGFAHMAAITSDGKVVAWGENVWGQLGTGDNSESILPVSPVQTGALAGKTVVSIAAGTFHTTALCSDGTVVGWGRNDHGQLGNNATEHRNVPVAVLRTGVLAGKTVVQIAAGRDHVLALCSDGTVAAWGLNTSGQLGIASTSSSSRVPVLVYRDFGALEAKVVVAVAAAGNHSMALLADGTVATWGANHEGQLGDNQTQNSNYPVEPNLLGPLGGKVIRHIAAGDKHSAAVAADGTMVAWGSNGSQQLGNPSAALQSRVPVRVLLPEAMEGRHFAGTHAGSVAYSNFALLTSPPAPSAIPLAAAPVSDFAATLNGEVNANGSTAGVTFEYGTSPSYGNSVAAGSVTGSAPIRVSAGISNLKPATTYHFRVVATSASGTAHSADMTFTTSSDSALASLHLGGSVALEPSFRPDQEIYDATVGHGTANLEIIPGAAAPGAVVKVNGIIIPEHDPRFAASLSVGSNVIQVSVTSPDGVSERSYTVRITRLPEAFVFDSASDVPVEAVVFAAPGNLPEVRLQFAPATGTRLTLVKTTGLKPILGRFMDLDHGQRVDLPFGGVIHHFVANYHGGDGNDLVLEPAGTRLVAWGRNAEGQLGNRTTHPNSLPRPVSMPGGFRDQTITAVSGKYAHTLALTAVGRVFAWGGGGFGELGNGTTIETNTLPVEVSRAGVLANRTVVALSAGAGFSVALCSDGSVVSWGRNGRGQLGDGTTTNRSTPVLVRTDGALSGKYVVAVEAGASHVIALCSDGTLVSWGSGSEGELGTGQTIDHAAPVAVNGEDHLAGKEAVMIAVGANFSMALCSDGTVLSWGENGFGELGNGFTGNFHLPYPVRTAGVLAGKSVVQISAGTSHALALCSDGSLASWGYNGSGELGDGSVGSSRSPVAVNRDGVLKDRPVAGVAGGNGHSLAVCRDGSLAAWGGNEEGQLGIGNNIRSTHPVLVSLAGVTPGERFVSASGGFRYSTAVVATPLPTVATLAATSITGTSATLRAEAASNGGNTSVAFDFGPTADFGDQVQVPGTLAPTISKVVEAEISGLAPATTYHFRSRAQSGSGIVFGGTHTFTTLNNNAFLRELAVAGGNISPAFDKETSVFHATAPFNGSPLELVVTPEDPNATLTVNGQPVTQGETTVSLDLPAGTTTITVVATAEDGETRRTYDVVVTRFPEVIGFPSPDFPPLTVGKLMVGGMEIRFHLGFAPSPGSSLMVVNHTGPGFIEGTFRNLEHGQVVVLEYEGAGYRFVANYFGGDGNDLVLHWADTELVAWGSNTSGQLGTATTAHSLAPTAVGNDAPLQGKTLLAVSGGYLHSLALASDGTLAAWGSNTYGQLGNGAGAASPVPVAVDASGVLAGRKVIAISAGPFHNLALCSDGTIASWGYNNHGQLGTGDKQTSRVPVLVKPLGALAGKQVIAVAAGSYHSFAICSDGSIAAWGYNEEGELGDGTTESSLIPVAVDGGGALSGKQVASISVGQYHALALCTDGTLVSWGYNNHGQLGTGDTADRTSPVAIGSLGALTGRTVVAIAAGGFHSLALCSDGTLAAWGQNDRTQLGTTGISHGSMPLAVAMPPFTSGRSIAGIAAGRQHNLVRFSDGGVAAWGGNASGELGGGSPETSSDPVPVDTGGLPAGARFISVASGPGSSHGLGIIAYSGSPMSAIESWRLAHFGSTANEGEGADDHACGGDGIPNLIKYAFGLKPRENRAGRLPQACMENGELVLRFNRPAESLGVICGAEWSDTLEPGSWKSIPDTGSADMHLFRLPVNGGGSRFMRLKVITR